MVFVEDSFLGNPDLEDGRYNTELGMYQPGCGIENLLMSWGHDEYLYQVTSQYLCQNDQTLLMSRPANDPSVLTITAPTRAFSWLKAPMPVTILTLHKQNYFI